MGTCNSRINEYEFTPNTNDVSNLKFTFKRNNSVLVSYKCKTSLSYYLNHFTEPKIYHHETLFNLSNVETLKIDLFTQTVLSRYDCINLANYIFSKRLK